MAKPDSTKAAPVKSTKMVSFVLEKETTGALRYAEADAKGQPINLKGPQGMDAAVVGALYVRKAAFPGAKTFPQSLTVAISF